MKIFRWMFGLQEFWLWKCRRWFQNYFPHLFSSVLCNIHFMIFLKTNFLSRATHHTWRNPQWGRCSWSHQKGGRSSKVGTQSLKGADLYLRWIWRRNNNVLDLFSFKAFLSKALTFDADQRASAKELLDHPFITRLCNLNFEI